MALYQGLCGASLGQSKAARKSFQRALELDPALQLPLGTSPRIVALFEELGGGRRTRPAESPAVAAAPAPTPSPAPSPQEPSRVASMGRVQVRVNPWAEVFYEGRRLGITPMPAIRLPAGRRTLTLKNKELGVSRDYRVSVPANGEVTLKADLLE
ncbi:hypothetical protein F0U62_45870 [Cystobacter fuscus]|uniref:hypothetical protein n=1 Tax=Cystobacter fuscus TaxID=43 RepID=UPI002B2EA318|nr:hypothetical protein F0U62_45870 [Cystobacter fuscus]